METITNLLTSERLELARDNNRFTCIPSVTGVRDHNWNVLAPGIYTASDVIPGFLRRGFITVNHDTSKSIADPIEAREVGNKLYSVGEFSSIDEAQTIKFRLIERLERGLEVGVSIGAYIAEDGYSWFESSAHLLDHLATLGVDMSLYDTDQILESSGPVRLVTRFSKLREYSYTLDPANEQSKFLRVHNNRVILDGREYPFVGNSRREQDIMKYKLKAMEAGIYV